jgi:flagellar motor switch protein FliN/FliY
LATLDNVSIDISVVLGRTAMPIHQVLRLGRGAIIELDSSEEDEVRILANNVPVARGMVIVSGNRIAVKSKSCCPACPKSPDPLLCAHPGCRGTRVPWALLPILRGGEATPGRVE